jgi:hypothetical protein
MLLCCMLLISRVLRQHVRVEVFVLLRERQARTFVMLAALG